MRRPLVVVTLVLGLLASLYGALILLDLLARSESRSTQPVPVSERVRLETGSGDLEVVADGGDPRIELRTQGGLWGEPKVKIRRGDDGLVSVESDCPGLSFFCSTEARLLVPAGTALIVRTGSGDVTVRDILGGVDVGTGSGDIALSGAGGPRVVADTGSGTIEVSGLKARTFQAETGSGDVSAFLADPPDDASVDTGSGDVELRLPDVGYDVATDTGSGEQQVNVRQDPGSTRRLRVDTGSGDITVRPPR